MHFPRTNKARVDTDEGKKFFWHSSFPKAFHQSSDVHSIVTDGSMHLSTIKQNIYSKCIVITETPVQNNSEKTFWSWAALAFPQGDRTEVNRAWWGCNSQFSEDKAFFGCFLAVCLCSFTILTLTQSTNSSSGRISSQRGCSAIGRGCPGGGLTTPGGAQEMSGCGP